MFFVYGVSFMNHQYVPVDQTLFKRHLKCSSENDVFISQGEFETRFFGAVECVRKQRGELFLSEMGIVTEHPITPLAEKAIVAICNAHGYKALCCNKSQKLKYLGSDGGGHYSTDFYRILEYGHIAVSVR